ncbi:hypothetical protein DYI95_003590 [Thermaerobacter sp. PB12/4term]|uniref:hypothetical protein n=1 Tax=Thermaerobacter sp. PB12/4term TaxID=2293838 RepID=UPI0011C04B3E|nr:hypothetical protein [Thermaerobacter sp. PB12/4term]QIA26723.1 hypothetical protein DYI95_003590 [Thermaerobacter sp. PB12/4term]
MKKLVLKMLRNPQAITRLEELVAVANYFAPEVQYRELSKHAMAFYRPNRFGEVTIPTTRQIKRVYVRQFAELIYDLIPQEWLEEWGGTVDE